MVLRHIEFQKSDARKNFINEIKLKNNKSISLSTFYFLTKAINFSTSISI